MHYGLAAAVVVLSCGVVYGLAWLLGWVLSRLLTVPKGLQPALPWLLVQLYLVGGAYFTGALPGAPRATGRLLLLMAGLSLLPWLLHRLVRRRQGSVGPAAFVLAGTIPWAVALVVDLAH